MYPSVAFHKSSISIDLVIIVSDATVLVEGDTVTFGHPAGKTIEPGARQRQPDSEYQFLVSEKLL